MTLERSDPILATLVLLSLTLSAPAAASWAAGAGPLPPGESPLDLAGSLLRAQEAVAGDDLRPLVQAQIDRIDAARLLLALDGVEGDALAKGVLASRIAMRAQADVLGIAWEEPAPLSAAGAPSDALLRLAGRHGVLLKDRDVADLRALDDSSAAPALAAFVESFLAFEDATAAAYARFDAEAAREALAGGLAPADLRTLGIDPAPLLPARARLLDAALALRDALARSPMSATAGTANFCPAFALDMAGGATTYAADCALILDVGGNDAYPNNAGGSSALGARDNPGSSCLLLAGAPTPAAAVVDLAGFDAYGTLTRGCGVVGGAYVGAGFLLDAEGDDTYSGKDDGVNAGGALGLGFLLDGGGHDGYSGGDLHVNAGGFGLLVDLEGDDTYTAGDASTNGGGHGILLDLAGHDDYVAGDFGTNGGNGFLYDGGDGSDTYTAGNFGTNGGGAAGKPSLLLDAGGNDVYVAGYGGTNGGAAGGTSGLLIDLSGDDSYDSEDNGAASGGLGMLLDGAGFDTYRDYFSPCSGTGYDRTVVPKCTLGAQIDRELTQGTPDLLAETNPDGTCTYYDDRDGDNAPSEDEAYVTGPCVP